MHILAGIVSGIIISIYGVCVTAVAGSLMVTVGLFSSGFVSSPFLLYLTYGVISGMYSQIYRSSHLHFTGWFLRIW